MSSTSLTDWLRLSAHLAAFSSVAIRPGIEGHITSDVGAVRSHGASSQVELVEAPCLVERLASRGFIKLSRGSCVDHRFVSGETDASRADRGQRVCSAGPRKVNHRPRASSHIKIGSTAMADQTDT